MRGFVLSFLNLAIAVLLVSCISPRRADLSERPGYVRHPAQPPSEGTQKWNPIWWFGNADDPQPPLWYRPEQKLRGTLWQLRNPLHNFTFYVIGCHDKEFVRRGREPKAVFHPQSDWNWAVIEKGWIRLPFVSYEGQHVRWYALWREKGNFGLKLQRSKDNSGRIKN